MAPSLGILRRTRLSSARVARAAAAVGSSSPQQQRPAQMLSEEPWACENARPGVRWGRQWDAGRVGWMNFPRSEARPTTRATFVQLFEIRVYAVPPTGFEPALTAPEAALAVWRNYATDQAISGGRFRTPPRSFRACSGSWWLSHERPQNREQHRDTCFARVRFGTRR